MINFSVNGPLKYLSCSNVVVSTAKRVSMLTFLGYQILQKLSVKQPFNSHYVILLKVTN